MSFVGMSFVGMSVEKERTYRIKVLTMRGEYEEGLSYKPKGLIQ